MPPKNWSLGTSSWDLEQNEMKINFAIFRLNPRIFGFYRSVLCKDHFLRKLVKILITWSVLANLLKLIPKALIARLAFRITRLEGLFFLVSIQMFSGKVEAN